MDPREAVEQEDLLLEEDLTMTTVIATVIEMYLMGIEEDSAYHRTISMILLHFLENLIQMEMDLDSEEKIETEEDLD